MSLRCNRFISATARLCVLGWCLALALSTASSEERQAAEVVVTIPNMHCAGCAKKIRGKLYVLPHVAKVTTILSRNEARLEPVQGKQLSVADIWETLEKAKFPPSKLVGPDGEFDKQPSRSSTT